MSPLASRLDRIAVDPEIVHGKPRIRGTRMTVQVVLELLSAGESIDALLSEYDELTRDDILAALEYAAKTAGEAMSAADSDAVDAAWRGEIRRRIDDIKCGKVELLDADEVHAQIRAELAANLK